MLSPFVKKEQRITYVEVSKIRPNPHQPRHIFTESDLKELSESIQEHGVIQPLTVREVDDGYELIVGERRLRASKKAGLKQIPVIIKEFDEEESAAIALVENLQRKDLDFIEEAMGYASLINKFDMTQKELAQKVGKGQSTIANKLRLLNLSDDIQKALIQYGLSERHGRALLKLDKPEDRKLVLEHVVEKELNVRDTEDFIKKLQEKKKEVEKEKSVIRVFKDLRLYTNTLWATVKELKQGGLDVKVEETENDDFIEFKIRLPKNQE